MLSEAAYLLRPDGALLIETWDVGSRIATLMGGSWQQLSPPSVVWAFSRRWIREALDRTGSKLKAAELLEITRQGLHKKMKRYEMKG